MVAFPRKFEPLEIKKNFSRMISAIQVMSSQEHSQYSAISVLSVVVDSTEGRNPERNFVS
jgi:hypothetical protein